MWIDPNVPRKGYILKERIHSGLHQSDDFPLFSLFELDITDLCNRFCEFCPRVNREAFPNKGEFMSMELYRRLMEELSELGYSGIIAYSGFSEPLLCREINEMVSIARASCPKSRIELYTNGDPLDAGKLFKLFKDGLSSIHISLYDSLEQKEKFLTMKDKAGIKDEQFFLRERFLKREEGYGLTLSNRVGMIDFEKTGMKRLSRSLKSRCYYPFYMMMVHYTGKVFICSHDWGEKLVVGDLNESSIIDIWRGKSIELVRNMLANADRDFCPCNACDVKGTLMGEAHFKKWEAYHRDR